MKNFLTAVLIMLAVVYIVSEESFEQVIQALERSLKSQVTNPKDLNGITLNIVPSSPQETMKGKFQKVEIASKPAKIKGIFLLEFRGLAIEPQLDVNALLKRGSLKTVSVKESTVEGVMDAEALEQIFANGKSTRPMNITVKFTEDDRVELSGKLTILKINNPFRAVCQVEPRKDGLHIIIDEIRVNGIPAPSFIRSKLENKVNPVVKRSDLPFNPEIRWVRIRNKLIHVSSTQPKTQ